MDNSLEQQQISLQPVASASTSGKRQIGEKESVMFAEQSHQENGSRDYKGVESLSSSILSNRCDNDEEASQRKQGSVTGIHHGIARAHDAIDLEAGLVDNDADVGLEWLAHVVAADAYAAQEEADEAHAAEREDGAEGRQGLLRGSVGATRRSMKWARGSDPPHVLPLASNDSGLSLKNPERYRREDCNLLNTSTRRVGSSSKHQFVRTLTLPKRGQTTEMELPIKDLLSYIQKAVRAVHVSKQQPHTSTYSGPGPTGSATCSNEGGAQAPQMSCRSTLHARSLSASNIGNTFMNSGCRQPFQAPLGGLLNARDVRRLVSGLDTESMKSKEMSIAVRRHTIVLNLDVIRCLILWDRIIVVIPEGADSTCFRDLEENLRCLRLQRRKFDMDIDLNGVEEEEFEFLALEAVLMTINDHFKSKLKDLRPHIIKNGKALLGNATLNSEHQDTLRQLKSKVTTCQAKVRSLHKTVVDLLDEEHLQMLHLTRTQSQQQQQQQQQQQHQKQEDQKPNLASAQKNEYHQQQEWRLRDTHETAMLGSFEGGRTRGRGCSIGGETDQQLAGVLMDAEDSDEAEILLESFLGDFNEMIMKWELIKEDM